MEKLSNKDKQLIIKNVLAACEDINKLNRRGYQFLYLANGFIAHYNLQGFKTYYTKTGLPYDNRDLKASIYFNKSYNQYSNFSPSDLNYEYYMDKKEVYNTICEGIKNALN
jgi:hypothetical protein